MNGVRKAADAFDIVKDEKSELNETDSIRPKHYNSHPSGVECIQIVQHYNFNVGNAIKYLWRQGLKDSEPSERDLKKAIQYIQFEIDRQAKGESNESE